MENEINLDPATLSPRKNMVRRFYKELWDRQDLSLLPELIHPDFTFRGSLGPVLVGHAQFGDYVRWLTAVLDNYTSDIYCLVEEGNTIAGKIRLSGTHSGQFFGFESTGRLLDWYGAPIFTFEGEKIRDLWVLGDIHGLLRQLSGGADPLDFRLASQ